MRYCITVCMVWIFGLSAHGQEQALYTQFFYNKLSYNTAFAGAVDGVELSFTGREQWLGLKGSPSIQSFQGNIPLVGNRVGVGAVLRRQSLGLTSHYTANFSYAYHIRYGEYLLGLSVNALVGNLVNDYREENLRTTQPVGLDPALTGTMEKATYFNAGASFLLRKEEWYMGLSVPAIANRHIAFNDDEEILTGDRNRFWHLMVGYAWPMGAEMIFNPQAMFSYSDDLPLKMDINLLMDFGENFLGGVGYRSFSGTDHLRSESISLIAGVKLSPDWFMTMAYDFGLSELRQHHNGSIEFSVVVYPGERDMRGEFRSPRFF